MTSIKPLFLVPALSSLVLSAGCASTHESIGYDGSGALDASSVCSTLCQSFQSVGCTGNSPSTCESDCLSQANLIPQCTEKVLSFLNCRSKAVSADRTCRVYYLLFSDSSCATEASTVGQCFLDATSGQDTECTAFCSRAYQEACPSATVLQRCRENCPLFVNTSTCKPELSALFRCQSQVPIEQFTCNGAAVSTGTNCAAETSAYNACEGAAEAQSSNALNAFGNVGVDPTTSTYKRSEAPAPTATTGACATTSLTGTIDESAVDMLFDGTAQGGVSTGSSWTWEVIFTEPGSATVTVPTSTLSNLSSLNIGTVLTGLNGSIALPYGLPRAESYLCQTGSTSLERAPNYVTLSYSGIGFLPECTSGTVVAGEIAFCEGSSCASGATGTIAGKSYNGSIADYSGTGQTFTAVTNALTLRTTYVATGATTATLKNSWLTDVATGNVYCAGASSYAEATGVTDSTGSAAYRRTYHFQDLRFVGNCSQVSGTDSLVVQTCQM